MNWRKVFSVTRLKYLWSIKGELALTALIVALFLYASKLFRSFDPTAGALDVSMIHFLVLAALGVATAIVAAFTAIHFAWPKVDDYIDGENPEESFESDWKKMSPTARVVTTLTLFGVVFVGFVVAFASALS